MEMFKSFGFRRHSKLNNNLLTNIEFNVLPEFGIRRIVWLLVGAKSDTVPLFFNLDKIIGEKSFLCLLNCLTSEQR